MRLNVPLSWTQHNTEIYIYNFLTFPLNLNATPFIHYIAFKIESAEKGSVYFFCKLWNKKKKIFHQITPNFPMPPMLLSFYYAAINKQFSTHQRNLLQFLTAFCVLNRQTVFHLSQTYTNRCNILPTRQVTRIILQWYSVPCLFVWCFYYFLYMKRFKYTT